MARARALSAVFGVGAALLVSGAAIAVGATAVTPPAGTPDLAAMALQTTDFGAGAVAAEQGYVQPTTGFTAEYDGGFTTATTPDGVSYYSIADLISIAPSASTVSSFFNAESAFFRSKQAHKLLDKVIIGAAGKKSHLKARNIKYGVGGSLGVGNGSSLETIALKSKHVSVHEDVVLFEQGTVYVLLTLVANPGETIPTSDATALATAIDNHVNSVLAGSTGPSGVTGSTG
jgi:hypothetical protein